MSNSKSNQEDIYDSPTGAPYIYSQKIPHPRGGKFIRLLELLPGDPSDNICCSLHLYALDSCPRYEALSYTWGAAMNTRPIKIDDEILDVTRKLRCALRHLRSPSRPRLLWVDAVCINQEDLDERTEQVSIMRDIYRSAIRTIVWLGPASKDSEIALSICRGLLVEQSTLTSTAISEKDSVTITHEKEAVDSPTEVVNLTMPQNIAVYSMVERPWFRRVWVVQEVGVAIDAIVVCGWAELNWDTFSRSIQYGIERGRFESNFLGFAPVDSFDDFLAIATIQDRDTGRPPAEQLLDLLTQFRVRTSSHPIDKVYSLLGLVENVSDLKLVPDYQLSAADAFTHTAVAIMAHSGNLDVLGACLARPIVNILGGSLPSWVADWSIVHTVAKPFRTNAKDQPRVTSATRDSTASPVLEENTILVLSGYVCDIIAEVSDVLTDIEDSLDDLMEDSDESSSGSGDDNSESLWGTLRSILFSVKALSSIFNRLSGLVSYLEVFLRWEKLAKVDQKDGIASTPTGEDHMSIYWQTLCAECMPNGYTETEKLFKEWYNSLNFARRLVRLRIDRLPSIFKPLAFVGHIYATWQHYSEFEDLMAHARSRRLARTENGYLCLAPPRAEKGDAIALCKGGKTPLVVRLEDGYWTLLGESYVHGIMKGEKFDEGACQRMLFK
jgi:Heterokaryon incompatibility protein (HET)